MGGPMFLNASVLWVQTNESEQGAEMCKKRRNVAGSQSLFI